MPAALGVALSPVPIVAVVLVLSTPRARSAGPAFTLGWILGLAAVGVLAMLLFNGADQAGSTTSLASYWLKVLVGVAFFALAFKMWRNRSGSGDEPEVPGWMASVETITPRRAALLGAGLSGLNPKHLALTMTAASSVAETGLDGTSEVIVLALFVGRRHRHRSLPVPVSRPGGRLPRLPPAVHDPARHRDDDGDRADPWRQDPGRRHQRSGRVTPRDRDRSMREQRGCPPHQGSR